MNVIKVNDHLIDLSFLRKIKAQRLSEFYNEIESKNLLQINPYYSVVLQPLGQDLEVQKSIDEILLTDDNDFVTKLTQGQNGMKKTRKIKGRVLYGGYLRKVWGHFLLGSLARLWPLVSKDFIDKCDKVLFFAEDKKMTKLIGNYLEIMDILGIKNKVVIIYNEKIYVEELLVPEIGFEHDRFNSSEFAALFDYIRDKVLTHNNISSITYDKIFLTRSQLKNAEKNEINIEKIDSFFAENGFKIIAPETYNIRDLIYLMEKASTVATLSGSLSHNTIFLSKGKKLLIIERHGMINTFQANINLMNKFNVTQVDINWMPYMSRQSCHVRLYGLTPQLEDFAKVNGLKIDSLSGCKEFKNKRRDLARFYKRYGRYYGRSQTISEWELKYADVLAEALIATRKNFSPWLEQILPVKMTDFLSPYYLLKWLKYKKNKKNLK